MGVRRRAGDYFWILFSAAVIVIAATVSPALAERRSRRRGP